MNFLTLIITLLSIGIVHCNPNLLTNEYEQLKLKFDSYKKPGDPLYLTKYIEDGKPEEGRRAASVKPFVGNVVSYSGYLTINKEYNSNMFFWYFQSEKDYTNAPTVVWLQGGPGTNMYLGVFNEHGPYIIENQKIIKRKYRWSKLSNIIYFDNPIGTGYSFTDNQRGYATNQNEIGKDLYTALIQIFKLFPHLRHNDLFITGESYAGKYVPALGYTIHEKNQNRPEIFLKLKGLMIGNGLTDPVNMLNYNDYLYQLGLIDDNGKQKFYNIQSNIIKLINNYEWTKATELFTETFRQRTSLMHNYTGLYPFYNYLDPHAGTWKTHQTTFIMSNYFRRRVHVGNLTLNDEETVFKHLYKDKLKSVVNWVAYLLQHYKILFYNGQLDLLVPYPFLENSLKNMKWPLLRDYMTAERHTYEVNDDVAGYYKTVGNLTEILVRGAGHMVPVNQPIWAYQLFNDFLNDKF